MGSERGQSEMVFCGTVIHATESCPMQVLENSALGVKGGKVLFLDRQDRLQELLTQHEMGNECVVRLGPRQWIMPGLVDCHIHSPQLPMQALGTDMGLLDWLQTYTFPTETRYAQHQFAREAHCKMVRRTLRGGTTLASYFSSIHSDTSLLLCQAANELGQRALVGKVNMDRMSPDSYVETTEQSLADTEKFIKDTMELKSSLVTPVITPRFAVTCSEHLMKELAKLARNHDLPVQTHLSESVQEIDLIRKLFPDQKTYTEVYDAMGLLGPKTILAHCIHMSDSELDLIIERGCGVVHCACSNTTLRSGLMDLRHQLSRGVKMGLGTDLAGGYTSSMLGAMRHSVDVSNILAVRHQHQHKHVSDGVDCERQPRARVSQDGGVNGEQETSTYQPLTMAEVFRLATLGGSAVLGQNCGNFEPGREFDAILVDPEVQDSPLDLFIFDSVKDVVHKFLYYGDDRNMVKIYVQGKLVVDKTM